MDSCEDRLSILDRTPSMRRGRFLLADGEPYRWNFTADGLKTGGIAMEKRPMNLQLFAEDGMGDTGFDDIDPGSLDTGDNGGQAPTNDTGDGQPGDAQKPEKTLTQAEVDKIIKDRLARAERKWRENDPANQFFSKVNVDPQLAIQAWEMQQQQNLEAQGLDPIMAQQVAHQQALMMQTKQDLRSVQLETEESRFLPELQRHGLAEDYEEHKEDVKSYALRTGMSLREAYFALRGADAISRASTNAEQRALARAKERAARGVEVGEGGGEMERLGLSAAEIAAARQMGIDPKKAAQLLKVNNLDDYRALKKG